MRKIRLVGIAALLLANQASSVTLTITPDKSTYVVGEQIVLNVVGDAQGASDVFIFGQLLFDTALATYLDSEQQTLTSFNGAIQWGADPLSGGSGFADAFAQGLFNGGTPDGLLIASVTLLAVSPGTLGYDWRTDGNVQFTLDFFGLSDAPGGRVEIVPEPSTAALVCGGLVLASALRRRCFEGGATPRTREGDEA